MAATRYVYRVDGFELSDDGTMDTVIKGPDGWTGRYDVETAGEYRDKAGSLDFERFLADVVFDDYFSDPIPWEAST